ncbi:TOMM precursor leader peptide-binding protein [Pelodictyon luteolum]|uniref:YcaO domain-containing protein n=1 Tax=Chlorobium luteolum (strain DSM 273 / BCRC 81028 / 2530) TaxID=319225 RepID=Q3B4I7_CHLL3|nr:TOMM precursor leader peptide-binding protein [Pelodictyon luteolum]ABB23744.1 Protein of unknown function DUF181 [Pelodictyon luteolum DSM 273]
MLQIPVFKAYLEPIAVPGEGLLLFSEDGSRAFHGSLFEQLARLIDGSRSSDEIVAALAAAHDAATVYYALMMLEKKGHITEHIPGINPHVAGFWQGLDLEPQSAIESIRNHGVRILGIGEVETEPLANGLLSLGVKIVDKANESTLDVVVVDDYLNEELAAISKIARIEGRSILPLRPSGFECWIGPLFKPDVQGCFLCLRHKLERHRLVHRFAVAHGKRPGSNLPVSDITRNAAYALGSAAIVKVLAGSDSGLEGRIFSLDIRTWASRTHTLSENPYCPVCGVAKEPRAEKVVLASGKATFMQDGGHRTVAPETTLEKYERFVSPITGVVNALVKLPQSNGTVHVYLAGHNSAVRLERLEDLKNGLRNASSGKGASEVQAKASALCEALERYSGESHGQEIRISGSYRTMLAEHGGRLIHPNAVMHYSERQYAERKTWNGRKSKFNVVPEPLDADAEIDWTPVWSLTDNCHKYLPTKLLYFKAQAGASSEAFYSVGCSNGNASGNTLEEAILQGFFELVERDAVAIWWYNMIRKPGVDIDSFEEPWFQELRSHYHSIGRELWVLDITTDLDIPAFAAFSALRNSAREEIIFGLGCHLDPRIALQRSLAEMNQMLGLADAKESDGSMRIEDQEVLSWLTNATRENQPYVTPEPTVPLRKRSDYTLQHSGELLADIETCRRRIEDAGMEMLVLDQTRADIGMPVAKVIVPGLRHFWARFGPGRLYDVPLAMHWLTRPRAEEELNPIPIFF